MSPEIGHFALLLALAVAAAQFVVPLLGASRGDPALMAFGRAAAGVHAGLIALAFACLMAAFAGPDFSVALVAEHSHSTQPLIYRLGATWGNHEGSMLLWVLILAAFGALIAGTDNGIRETLRARVLGIQGGIGALFLAFIVFTSNPFTRLIPAPAEGNELNPLLQDPGLILHPPLLYVGYVGFSVAFAFAAAALIEGRADAHWARAVRPWVLLAWTALTAGIAAGSHWAYYTLGWGGWWFWDPVENASLMPWLVGTALLHSVSVLERRGALISWTLLLAILAFTLSLIGTFLVRSGVLTSVHAFAVDPARGIFILGMVVGQTGIAFALFAWRAPHMRSGALFGAVSRESGLVANNILLASAAATVFLGTFYPVLLDVTGGDKISVGPPYYAITFAPMMAALLVVLSAGPMLQWRRDTWTRLWPRVRRPAIVAGVVAMVTVVVAGPAKLLVVIGFALAAWVVAGAVAIVVRRWRIGSGDGPLLRRIRATPPSVYGLIIAHLGMGIVAAGVTAASAFSTDRVATMRPGDKVTIGGVTARLDAFAPVQGPNFQAIRADFTLISGSAARLISSERRFYPVSGTRTTVAGITDGFFGNTYVAIGDPGDGAPDGALVVRLYDHPLVGWIWAGPMLMALGGLFSLVDRRHRIGAPVRTPAAATGPVPFPQPA